MHTRYVTGLVTSKNTRDMIQLDFPMYLDKIGYSPEIIIAEMSVDKYSNPNLSKSAKPYITLFLHAIQNALSVPTLN